MAVKARRPIYAYKTIKGPLHRIPALFKILGLIPLSIVCMILPLPALAAGIAVMFLCALACGFSPVEQVTDLRPSIFYGAFMLFLSVSSRLYAADFSLPVSEFLIAVFAHHDNFLLLSLRLVIIMQLSALLFRSTTTLEIRNSMSMIETRVRRTLADIPPVKKHISIRPRIAENLSLFAGFIPEIFQTWTQINKAWSARGGKSGFKKIKTLVFVLVSISFEKAARKAAALAAREG